MMDIDEGIDVMPGSRFGQKMFPDFYYDKDFPDVLDNSVFD